MEKKLYPNNFINEVIFRIDTIEKNLIESNKINKISKIIISETDLKFKTVNTKPSFNINIKDNEGELNINSSISSYKFFNLDEEKYSTFFLEITKNSIILDLNYDEKRKYNSNEDLIKYIEVIKKILAEYNITETKYIGLRYINIINFDGNPMDWNGFINESLLNNDNTFIEKYNKNLLRNIQKIEFKYNQCNIIFQFGQFNSEYPNPIARKEYVLDYDCNSKEIENTNDILEIFYDMNNIIYKLFEESIGTELKDLIKKEEVT